MNNQDFSVRPLTYDDCDELAELRAEAEINNPGMFASTYEKITQNTPDEWRSQLSGGNKCMFGLCKDGKIIGGTGVFTWKDDPENRTGIVATVYISPAYRGMQLSDMLHRACIVWALGYRQWRRIVASCRADNPDSRRAIERQGFVFMHKTSRTWSDGVTSDEVWYELDLEKWRHAQ
jgi:RimJ/RimL family protein N-acetyltransferase